MPVPAAAVLTRGNFAHSTDDVIPHFRRITDAFHDHGTVMIQQLYHVGAHGDWDNAWHPGWSPLGGVSYHDNDGSHAMTGAAVWKIAQGSRARFCAELGSHVAMISSSACRCWMPPMSRQRYRVKPLSKSLRCMMPRN